MDIPSIESVTKTTGNGVNNVRTHRVKLRTQNSRATHEIKLPKHSSSNHGSMPLRSWALRVARSRWQGQHDERRQRRLNAIRRSVASSCRYSACATVPAIARLTSISRPPVKPRKCYFKVTGPKRRHRRIKLATVNISRTAKIKRAHLGRDSAMWSMWSRRMGIGPREHNVYGLWSQ